MSGLKINFLKCEVVTMGMNLTEGQRVAGLLNYKLGSFPVKYLGLPISNKNISILEWEPLYSKVAGRVCPWQGKFMSSGARLILPNSSLSSLPMFTMGMFLLADGVHVKLDTPRARFFWEGAGTKRKYHLVKWAAICRPKNQGGLGVINSKLMNVALLSKWIWKLLQNVKGQWGIS
jgi:hypothetical protein